MRRGQRELQYALHQLGIAQARLQGGLSKLVLVLDIGIGIGFEHEQTTVVVHPQIDAGVSVEIERPVGPSGHALNPLVRRCIDEVPALEDRGQAPAARRAVVSPAPRPRQ